MESKTKNPDVMIITFRINYRTAWGEEVGVRFYSDESRQLMLSTNDGEHWKGTFELPDPLSNEILTYYYGVYRDGQCERHESKVSPHIIEIIPNNKIHYIIDDDWKDLPINSFLYSSAFNSDRKFPIPSTNIDDDDSYIVIRAITPGLNHRNSSLGISGEGSYFGNWDKQRAITMREVRPNEWMTLINTAFLDFPIEFKFVSLDNKSKEINAWEDGYNRVISLEYLKRGDVIYTREFDVCFGTYIRKIAGTAIPVFSLKSKSSFGVGDFGDLKLLIDWAVVTNQQAIQILPINDTTITNTWTDSYPYNSISIYAFHPMYIDLSKLGKLNDIKQAEKFEKRRRELNELAQIDYEAVNAVKREYLKQMFVQQGEQILESSSFAKFFDENNHWLRPYAAFSYLRDKYATPDYNTWPEYSKFDEEEIARLCSKDSKVYNEIAFYYYIQYILHVQLLEASNYAREKGIIFKGDIPIGISRNSVEAWIEPYYFNMNGQAGAPPDAFSTKGQNWGFPTYNWEVMEKDNYQWWQRRFRKMAEYFTAYRIDHILGFFRIWEIPTHSVHGLLGQFSPSLPMSVNEIQSYGLQFNEDFMTRPFINEEVIERMFGDKKEEIKNKFLNHCYYDIYEMRPEFDTQRKVESYFADHVDQESLNIKESLYSLISNVLFGRDRKNPSMYHPRIAVQNDYIFERLSWQEKEAFNRLYNHYYYQRHNNFWYQEAMKKLPVLTESTDMLVCGEDLGMVPDCVPWVMDKLQIVSLEIQRMPKNPKHEFGHVWEYPYRSVCTISTHDMSTLRGWWEEDYLVSSKYYSQVLGHWDKAPVVASGSLCEEIVKRHLESPSLLCILTFQDWLSMDEEKRNPDIEAERINVPANPRHYWRYRMHLSLEDLMNSSKLNFKIKDMIDRSGRA